MPVRSGVSQIGWSLLAVTTHNQNFDFVIDIHSMDDLVTSNKTLVREMSQKNSSIRSLHCKTHQFID